MLHFHILPHALVLLLTTIYAFPSDLKPNPRRSGGPERDIPPFILKNPGRSTTVSASSTRVQTPTIALEPGWPIRCNEPSRRYPTQLDTANCRVIAVGIENKPDSSVLRIYSAADGELQWVHGDCYVNMWSPTAGATDVFQPLLIAHDIRRVLQACGPRGVGGTTSVGPREKFCLLVTNYYRGANRTAMIE